MMRTKIRPTRVIVTGRQSPGRARNNGKGDADILDRDRDRDHRVAEIDTVIAIVIANGGAETRGVVRPNGRGDGDGDGDLALAHVAGIAVKDRTEKETTRRKPPKLRKGVPRRNFKWNASCE